MKNYNFLTSTDADKQSDDFGLWFCRSIINRDWFSGRNNRYSQKVAEYNLIAKHMNGEPDVSKYKKMLNDGDLSSDSIDYAYKHIMPKYVKLLTDGFNSDVYKVVVSAVDEMASKESSKKKALLKAKMMLQPEIKKAEQELGYKLSYDDVPETEEDYLLRVQLDDKLEREVAFETAITKIFDVNDIDEVANMVSENLVLYGVGVIGNRIDSDMGVVIKSVNPQNFIYSESSSNSRTADGRYYFGEVMSMPISEIRRLSNNKFKESDYAKMTNKTTVYESFKSDGTTNDDDEMLTVLRFCFKTTKNDVYRKKHTPNGKYTLERKDESWNPEYNKHNKVVDVYDTWYEGWWVVGTDYIWGYGEMKDLIRPNSNIKKAIPPYAMYEIQTHSIGKRLLAHIENLQIINIKVKKLLINAVPNGFAVDFNALQEFDLGGGVVISPAQQVQNFFSSGRFLFSGQAMDGSQNKMPFYPVNNSIGTELGLLNNAYVFELEQIENITGINKFRDGSTPSGETAVGVQKTAIMMSNNATKHIPNGMVSILKHTADCCVCRLQDLTMYGEIGKGIAALIGVENAKIISKDKNKFFWAFSTTIKMKPTEEEKQELKGLVAAAINAKTITIADAIDINNIDNPKLAAQLLKSKEKAKLKREEEMQREAIQMKAAEDRKTQLTMAQAEQIKKQAEMQAMQAEVQMKAQADVMKMANEWKFKFKYQQQEFMNDYRIKELEVSGLSQRESFKENEKKERIKEQGNISSKIAEQKANKLPAVDFKQQQINM